MQTTHSRFGPASSFDGRPTLKAVWPPCERAEPVVHRRRAIGTGWSRLIAMTTLAAGLAALVGFAAPEPAASPATQDELLPLMPAQFHEQFANEAVEPADYVEPF